jgi:hypothetical protein
MELGNSFSQQEAFPSVPSHFFTFYRDFRRTAQPPAPGPPSGLNDIPAGAYLVMPCEIMPDLWNPYVLQARIQSGCVFGFFILLTGLKRGSFGCNSGFPSSLLKAGHAFI